MSLELRTARLVLLPVTEDDLDALLAIRNAPAVVATTETRAELPRDRMEGQLGRRCESWRTEGFGSWLVLLEGAPVGYVELTHVGEGEAVDADAIELGVVIHPDHWGKGLAVEAAMAAVRDLGDRLGVERIYAGIEPDNEKSHRALAKMPGVTPVADGLYEIRADAFPRHDDD